MLLKLGDPRRFALYANVVQLPPAEAPPRLNQPSLHAPSVKPFRPTHDFETFHMTGTLHFKIPDTFDRHAEFRTKCPSGT